MEETRVCIGPCGLEKPLSKFGRQHLCSACRSKRYRINNPEMAIKHKLLWSKTPGGKLCRAKSIAKWGINHPKELAAGKKRANDKACLNLTYGYVKANWQRSHADIEFTREIWLKEKIRLQAKRRLQKIKKQLNLK